MAFDTRTFIKIGLLLLFSAQLWGHPPWQLRKEYYYWPMFLAQQHLINMTAELLKDAEYKMMRAMKIHDSFKGTKDFEIGYIASYVQDRFKHMLHVYRGVTDMEGYQWYYTVYEVISALMFVESDYHEILALKDLFLEVIKFHEGNKKGRAKERFKEMLQHLQLLEQNTKNRNHRRSGGPLEGGGERNYMKNSSSIEDITNSLRDRWKPKFLLEGFDARNNTKNFTAISNLRDMWRPRCQNDSDLSRELEKIINL